MLSLLQSLRSRLSQWDPQLYQACPCPWGSSSPPLVNPTPYPNPNPNACMSRTPSCEPSTSSTRPTARTRACSGGEPLRNCTAALVDACTHMAGGLRAVSTCVGPCMPSPPPLLVVHAGSSARGSLRSPTSASTTPMATGSWGSPHPSRGGARPRHAPEGVCEQGLASLTDRAREGSLFGWTLSSAATGVARPRWLRWLVAAVGGGGAGQWSYSAHTWYSVS